MITVLAVERFFIPPPVFREMVLQDLKLLPWAGHGLRAEELKRERLLCEPRGKALETLAVVAVGRQHPPLPAHPVVHLLVRNLDLLVLGKHNQLSVAIKVTKVVVVELGVVHGDHVEALSGIVDNVQALLPKGTLQEDLIKLANVFIRDAKLGVFFPGKSGRFSGLPKQRAIAEKVH